MILSLFRRWFDFEHLLARRERLRRRCRPAVELLEDRRLLSLTPQLLKDINLAPPSSAPGSFMQVGGIIFFTANEGGDSGTELWRTDGTSAGTLLVKDINAGSADSSPSFLTNLGGTLFFQANDGTHGFELWRSDGSSAGTLLVKDVRPGTSAASPSSLTNANGTLFFTANDGTNGRELWRSDGSSAGTLLVKDIKPGNLASFPSSLTNANGTLFFSADDGATGTELWRSDGSSAGTVLVNDIRPVSSASSPYALTNVNGTLFFAANDGTNGTELWRSDGSSAGTLLVKDIKPGNPASFPSSLTNANGTLFFSANDGATGTELWRSDGSSAGTTLVNNIQAGNSASSPYSLANVNGTLFFSANDGTHGMELWRSDGSSAGTTLVSDLFHSFSSSYPTNLTNVNGTLFFDAEELAHGDELWRSNGTSAGTTLVYDIRPGPSGSYLTAPANLNGTLFFAADDGTHGVEPWRSDGSSAGTLLVSDIRPSNPPSSPSSFASVNGTVFFSANDSTHGTELWQSDGSNSGTVLTDDINTGTPDSVPFWMTNVNGTLFFQANGTKGFELWRSNGSSTGTTLVDDIRPGGGDSYPASLTNVNGTLFFSAGDGSSGRELWRSDGTSAGTTLVKDIRPGGSGSTPYVLINVNGALFFEANDGTHGFELWRSDGTSAGTVLVKDINSGASASYPYSMTNVNGTLFFRATDAGAGREIWRSDGTSAGTLLVKDVGSGTAGSYPYNLVNVGGTLFFEANDATHGYELWRSDGSSAGTTLVTDSQPGSSGSYPNNLTNVNGTLFFAPFDSSSVSELWRSDGSSAGTTLVKNIDTSGDYLSSWANGNGTLFFQANDGTHGSELWMSNGNSAGTLLVSDIHPGTAGSSPSSLANINGTLFFSADDGATGAEPWILLLDQPPVANGDSYSANENTTLTVPAPGVLANDTDPDGYALTVSSAGNGAHGTVSMNADGSFSYTPSANFFGTDSFTYRTIDSGLNANSATVTIVVNPSGVVFNPVLPSVIVDFREITYFNGTQVLTSSLGTLDPSLWTNPNGNLGTLFRIYGFQAAEVGQLVQDADNPNQTYPITADANGYYIDLGGPHRATVPITWLQTSFPSSNNVPGIALDHSLDTPPHGEPGKLVDFVGFQLWGHGSTAVHEFVNVQLTFVNPYGPGLESAQNIDHEGFNGYGYLDNSPVMDGVRLNDLFTGPDTSLPAGAQENPTNVTLREQYTVPPNAAQILTSVNTSDDTSHFYYGAIRGIGTAPTACNDGYSTDEDRSLNVTAPGVLVNDVGGQDTSYTAVLVSTTSHGTLTLNSDGSFIYKGSQNFIGTDSFTYKTNDGALNSNLATATIVVGLPVANNDSYSFFEDQTLSVSAAGVLGNDTDADGDTFTARLVGGPTHGTLTLQSNGAFTYRPSPDYNGGDSFTYLANDGALDANVATVTLTIIPVNDAPVACDDLYSVFEDQSLGVGAPGVLGNDFDIDSPTLTALLVNAPLHGTLTLNANGSIAYVPAANYNGTDSFTYKANDGQLNSNVATVSVEVVSVNDPPVSGDDSYSVFEDATLSVAAPGVLNNDSDIDSPTLTPLLAGGPGHGTLTFNADGSFTYAPSANYNGTDSFTYRTNDGALASNLATVTIVVDPVNDAPVAGDDARSVFENGTLSVAAAGVLLNDSDIDSPTLTALLVTAPVHGTLTLNADGSLTYVLNVNYSGTDSFTYKANDGLLNSNVATVSITVVPVNQAPTANNDAYSLFEDFTLTKTAPGVLANDTDIDSAVLTTNLVAGPAHGTLTFNTNGAFTYVPGLHYFGTDSFTYKANDGLLNSDVATVKITVIAVNHAPVANSNSYSVFEDSSLSVSTPGVLNNDSDIDGNSLTSILLAGPAHGTLTLRSNGAFSYTPATHYSGGDSFTYRANDGALNSTAATVTLNVLFVNHAPTANNDAYTVQRDTTLTVAVASGVLANDTDVENSALSAILSANPGHGSVTLNSNGSFTYAPSSGFVGTDSFRYRANDGSLNSSQATVTLTVQAPGPVAPSATDVSDLVRAVASALTNNHDGTFSGTITITNITSDTDIDGPLQVVLTNLTSGVTVQNKTGDTPAGNPYITIPANSLPGGKLGHGQSVQVTVVFDDPLALSIGYVTKPLSGAI